MQVSSTVTLVQNLFSHCQFCHAVEPPIQGGSEPYQGNLGASKLGLHCRRSHQITIKSPTFPSYRFCDYRHGIIYLTARIGPTSVPVNNLIILSLNRLLLSCPILVPRWYWIRQVGLMPVSWPFRPAQLWVQICVHLPANLQGHKMEMPRSLTVVTLKLHLLHISHLFFGDFLSYFGVVSTILLRNPHARSHIRRKPFR